jgi:hypothetical protein
MHWQKQPSPAQAAGRGWERSFHFLIRRSAHELGSEFAKVYAVPALDVSALLAMVSEAETHTECVVRRRDRRRAPSERKIVRAAAHLLKAAAEDIDTADGRAFVQAPTAR